MQVLFIRSSSYNNYDFCSHQYFLNYVLGIPSKAGKKANQGTAVHKVMEVLANCKKMMQNNSDQDTYQFFDDKIGLVEWTSEDFLKPQKLNNEEIDSINKTRINKNKYKHDASLPYNTTRYGTNLVEDLIQKSIQYYCDDTWELIDKRDCHNWSWMTLEYKNGIFDPRKRTIIDAEPRFDIEIDRPWANYEWIINGQKVFGKLRIKGTIDLVTQVDEGILEVVDFKSGQRLNWNSTKNNDIKTYGKLCEDFQLMLYHYAASVMYPNFKQIIVTIFFIRDGGPFTICMDEITIQKTEELLQRRFEQIKNDDNPKLLDYEQKHFKCTYLCDYYKMKDKKSKTNMCHFIHEEIQKYGIDYVTENYRYENFDLGNYEAPGEK